MKKAILNTSVFLLVAIVVVFFLLYICGFHPYITKSGSMEPAIRTGSVCIVDTNVEFGSIVKGDIIAFDTPTGNHVTHRAISITDEAIETKGDVNDVSDGFTTTKENYIGKTVFSIPYLGYVISYLQQPVGKRIILAVILSLIISIIYVKKA